MTLRGLVCLLLTVSLLPALPAQQKQKPKSVKRLNNGLKDVRSSKERAVKELKKTDKKVVQVKGDINEVEGRLQALESKLAQTTDKLDDARSKQTKLSRELFDASKKLEARRKEVQIRLRRMYTVENSNAFSVLVGSKTASDLAARQFLLERVAKKDRQVFNEFEAYRKLVDRKKREQDQVVRQVNALASDQREQQNGLVGVRREKEGLLANLKDKQTDLKKMIRQFEADEAAIESDIRVAMARAKAEAVKNMAAAKKAGKKYVPPPRYTGRFGRPTGGRITSSYGMRFHPILKYNRLHKGIDFGGGYGAAVMAAGDGTVIAATQMSGYGNTIIIDHGGGLATVYGHLSRISVGTGQTVRRGQRIGAIGSSGLSTGPHLHFEVHVNGRHVNPMSYL